MNIGAICNRDSNANGFPRSLFNMRQTVTIGADYSPMEIQPMPAYLPLRMTLRARNASTLIACMLLASAALTGCGSGAAKAQKRAYKADEAVSKERLRLIDEYEKCLSKAEDNANKQAGCERYLKSAEALQ
jgi:hypothetical protein